MASMTVFLAPSGPADGVLAALTDLSAAGLIEGFYWLRDPDEKVLRQSVLRIEGGRQFDVSSQEMVSAQRTSLLRICVVVPLTDAPVLSAAQESFTTNLLSSTSGTLDTVRVRCLLARPGVFPHSDAVLAVEGWHNVVISPEDGLAPGMGYVQLSPEVGTAEIGRYAAPVVAALLGLWAGLDHRPLDSTAVLPGQVVRLARSFYRKIETGDAETALRNQLLAQNGTLPLPTDQRSPVAYAHDVSLAASTMADQLWRKHNAILRGPRREYERHATGKISVTKALRLFFGFLWAALKNAPAAWYRRIVDSVSSGIAASVNRSVFGSDSAFEVVVNGRTARGDYAGWLDIADASSRLAHVLGASEKKLEQSARADLSQVWQDYSRAAMTLGDAGARSAELPPIQIGAGRGILIRAADIVPGPAQRFTAIPGVVAAAVELDGVDATDPLGIQILRYKLADLERIPERGLQARSTLNALEAWQSDNAQSFGVQVGRRLSDAFGNAYGEVQNYLRTLSSAPPPPPEPGKDSSLLRWVQVTMLALLILTGVLSYLAIADVWIWWKSLAIGLFAYALGFGLCLRAFMRSQQELFQLLHRRRTLLGEKEVDGQNLRTALRDLNRLSQAYGEYLAWSRAIGAFLAAPLGPDEYRSSAGLSVAWGFPLSTAVGYAAPDDRIINDAVGNLRHELFSLGWLSAPWSDLVLSSESAPLGVAEPVVENASVWAQPGVGSGSALDCWATALFTGRQTSTGADGTWERAQHSLRTTMSQLVDSIVGWVQVPGGGRIPRSEFLAQIDDPEPPSTSNVDQALLTDLASTRGAGRVTQDVRGRNASGLGVVCVATQLTDGIPEDYLTLSVRKPPAPRGFGAPIPEGPAESSCSVVASTIPVDHFNPPGMGGGFHV